MLFGWLRKRPSCWLLPAAALAFQPALAAPAPPPAPIVQQYQPRPAIWLLADEDTKIYMLGTVHMLPPGFKWRSRAVDRVVDEAGELVVESYDPPGQPAAAQQMMRGSILTVPMPILSRVPEQRREALRAAIATTGAPPEMFGMLRTWAAAVLLGLMRELKSWGVSSPNDAPGVEDALEAEFRAAKKPISSIEKVDEALATFNALSEEEQVSLLVETAEKPLETEYHRKGNHLWAQGRLEEAGEVLFKDFPMVVYDGLVRKRNAAWTEWLSERMKQPGVILLAVGAGHLMGKDSVQAMLEQWGLEARRFD